jgi:hypothetical protein
VNRYWSFTKVGSWTFTSYDATFTFVATDVDAGTNTSQVIVRRYDGAWNTTTTGTRTATTTQATGLTALERLRESANRSRRAGHHRRQWRRQPDLRRRIQRLRPIAGLRGRGSRMWRQTPAIGLTLGNGAGTLGGTLTGSIIRGREFHVDLGGHVHEQPRGEQRPR